MDTLYAVALIVATATAVVAILASLLPLIGSVPHLQSGARVWKVLLSHRLARGALVLGVFSLIVSVLVHSRWGHGPGTVAPMGFGQLLSEHEAFPTVGAMLLLALLLIFFRNRHQRDGSAI